MTDLIIGQRPPSNRWGCLVAFVAAVGGLVAVILGLRACGGPSAVADGNGAPESEERPVSAERSRSRRRDPSPPARESDPGEGLQAVRPRLEEAEALEARGQLGEARERLFELLESPLDGEARAAVEHALGRVHTELVFNPHPMPEKREHVVARGESLAILARRYGTTVELISRSNRITNPHRIRVGDRLRILQGAFSVEVSKTRNDLVLRLDDRFFKRYRVGTGEFARTPEGSFRIVDRIENPTWWRDDGKVIPYGHPDNLLGTHWLALDVRGYGLHGTWEPETIGHQLSAGCVRLLNEDVLELFELLPVGTPVTITE